MKALVLRLVRNDEGQDLIEYVLIGTLVSIAVARWCHGARRQPEHWYDGMAGWVQTSPRDRRTLSTLAHGPGADAVAAAPSISNMHP